MTTESRKRAGTAGPQAGGAGNDGFLERLGDRISSQHDIEAPPAAGFGGPPPKSHASDVHALPGGPVSSEEDDALEFPPIAPHEPADAFAEFEEMTGEATRIDDSHLLAEQSTAILEEAPRQPFLAVERGNDQGREFVLQEGENGVGRGIDNDVILADVAVSRRHLRIIRAGDQLTLRDLGSGNGTLVNGKRHASVLLVDGDRLELGETVLVVRIPGSELRPEGADEHTTEESHVTGSLPPPAPTPDPMAPGYHPELTPRATSTQHIDRVPRVKGAIVLPKPVFVAILLGGALLIAMLAATMAILLVSGGDDDESEVVQIGTGGDSFSRGLAAYEGRRWDEAERAFREALQESSDPRANTYLQRTQQARIDEGLIARANSALEAGNTNDALTAVGGVPGDSPFATEAQNIRRQAILRTVDEHAQAGQRALAANNLAEAGQQLQRARQLDPTRPAVRELATALAARGGSVPPIAPVPIAPVPVPSVPPAPTPVPPVAVQDEPEVERGTRSPPIRDRRSSPGGANAVQAVIADYLAGRFDQAVRNARAASGRATGAERGNLTQLADRISRFGQLYSRIQAANFGPSVRAQMQEAMALDRQIARNPLYSNRLRTAVVNAHLADARRTRSQPQQSCNSVRQALAVDSSHAEARQMGSQCENIARGMLREAGAAPPPRAEGIYRQVLLMVPRASPVGTEASTRLDALRRRSSFDEDE